MNRPLDLSAVSRIAVACFKICIYVNCDYITVFVFFNARIFNYICAHKSDLTFRLETEELRRRYLGKVVRVDIKFAGKRELSRSRRLVIGVVRYLKIFGLIRGIVIDYELYRMKNGNSSLRFFVQLFPDTVFKQSNVYKVVILCNARTRDEIKY